MEKTINCEVCGIEFTFEENPKFPRKYCLNCSAKKKKEFEQGTHEEIEPEVVKPGTASMEYKTKDNGFHLTPENIRASALRCAVEDLKGFSAGGDAFWNRVRMFEKYIVTGE